jgi:hypothetical protein
MNKLLAFFLIISSGNLCGQIYETNPDFQRTKVWYFGYGIGMSFGKDTILIDTNYRGWNYEGTAILNDKQGNLKFYSDGKYLYNKNHQIKNTKESLLADNSSCQGVILFDDLKDSTLIHILTTSPTYSSSRRGYRHSVFNVKSDSFVFINKLLIGHIGEKQATINHQNNRYIWATTHSLLNDTFYSFLIDEHGLTSCPVINKTENIYKDRFPSQGVLKFSPSGKLLYSANWSLLNFELISFNPENGLFYSSIVVPFFAPSTGEFSKNEQSLYIVDRGQSLFKFNTNDILNNTNVSFDTIVTYFPSEFKISQIQMSNINSIFIARYQDTVISELKTISDTLQFVESAIYLKGRKSLGGLPNFNASYFYTPSIDFAYTEDCWEHTYSFEGRDTFEADGYKWIFEKNGFRDSILTKHCSYQFPDTGSWQVSHIAWNTNRADTVTKTLTIRPKWQKDVLGRDTFYCAGSKALITLRAPADMHCVHWNGEEPNLDDALGPIVDYDHFHTDTFVVDTAGTYIVKLTNKTFCQMYDTIVVAEKPRPSKSVVSRLGNLLSCDVVASKYRWYYNGALQQTTDSNFLDPNQNGNWQVQLVSEFGCESELSDSILVDFASIDPRLQDTGQLTFKIYPNPSSGKFTIELAKDGIYTIQLFDIGGRLVSLSADPKGGVSKTEQGKVRSINKQLVLKLELAAGSYTLQLTDENGNVGVKKVVVE